MKKILLHVCCGPCGIYPLEKLQRLYDSVAVFYYNPNIHPQEEYLKRKQTVKNYCKKNKIKFIAPEYNAQQYFDAIKGTEKIKQKRCPACYHLRLQKTAQYAKNNNFTAFTSTLLISPQQDIQLIKKIGQELAQKNRIDFYSAEDETSNKKYKGFRPGYARGRQKSKAEAMYHQHYCGCIFSLNEL